VRLEPSYLQHLKQVFEDHANLRSRLPNDRKKPKRRPLTGKGSKSSDARKYDAEAVAGLILSESKYFKPHKERITKWSAPGTCKPDTPVAFIHKMVDRSKGQELLAVGRFKRKRSGEFWEDNKSVPFWDITDFQWLDKPVARKNLTRTEGNQIGKMGGFGSYHVQGSGCAVRGRDEWNALVEIIQDRNPKKKLGVYRV
jgi:hypothetical protein